MSDREQARILCLDDERVGLAVRVAVLRHAGYTVLSATSAEEALQIFTDQPIDLVISDHLLRGTTGTQVALSMKRIRSRVPIVILSGLVSAPEGIEYADIFMSKLEPPSVLLATIASMLPPGKSVAKVKPSQPEKGLCAAS